MLVQVLVSVQESVLTLARTISISRSMSTSIAHIDTLTMHGMIQRVRYPTWHSPDVAKEKHETCSKSMRLKTCVSSMLFVTSGRCHVG